MEHTKNYKLDTHHPDKDGNTCSTWRRIFHPVSLDTSENKQLKI
jgi:hypothetical protein